MPMMRDMLLSFPQGLGQILDDRPEVGARRQRFGAGREDPRTGLSRGPIPGLGERTAQPRLFLLLARLQPRQLLAERGAAGLVELARAGLLERFLDLEHLGQETCWTLGPGRLGLGLALALAPALKPHEILHPADGIAEGPVRGVDPGRCRQAVGLFVRRVALVEVRVMPARQLVKAPL